MPSDLPEIPEAPSEKAAESARIRRRWLSLGETVAVVAVVISALTLWNNYDERKSAEAERSAEKAPTPKSIGLIATDAGGAGLDFKAADCALQSTDIRFPAALGVGPESTVLKHRIEADWFESALLKALDKDVRDGRLPVAITSRCEAADGPRTETAIYDIVYHIQSRAILGRTLKLRGLIRRKAAQEDGLSELDGLWKP
ncbi:hypothetical protein [Sphingosinicella soli]|uniref:Uncharacterized protein n=1 Tax=Sphingosinicella soli TaxID=333708 RepID=A0A7W7F5F4_9SPHN|nr:hypothetical protein [Sphingosinicella soli]MBB4631355.1 hypothetical protein [Sphingosinicella soli]